MGKGGSVGIVVASSMSAMVRGFGLLAFTVAVSFTDGSVDNTITTVYYTVIM